MGLFGFGKKKENTFEENNFSLNKKEEPVFGDAQKDEIIIPNHAKPVKVEKKDSVKKVSTIAQFQVNGLYDIGSQVMVSGIVSSGALRKKMKTKINGKDIPISDLKIGSDSVKEIENGFEGKIFLRAKGVFPVKDGDVLVFK